MLRKPLPLPHSLNRSPMRVRRPVPVVWCPVRTSASSNRAATRSTHARVYSEGWVRGLWVDIRRGRKHGSPASNLYPSTPYFSRSASSLATNHVTAFGLVTSSATTGGVFHHLKKPGSSPPRPSSDWTKYPNGAPSLYASVFSSTNGITHSVTLNPMSCSSSTIPFGSGNLSRSKSSSPYPACHLSSISITDPVSPLATISRAKVSVLR